tara:strand:+ start:3158 stop:4144 length:987 start_codon:yes stop_codon:yes gene_type:complete
MQNLLRRLLLLGILFFLSVSCQSSESSAKYVFKASMLVNENHTWYKSFMYFGNLLHERSEGQIKLEVYPSEQLAKEVEAIRLIQAGVIDMTISAGTLANWEEILTFSDMPFLLRDAEAMKKLIESPIGEQIEQVMIKEMGLRPVGYFQRGERHLTSNRPIKHPDDLKGLIIRVPNAPSYVIAWQSMGAKPIPMAFSEVFTALQQGTIEAQENPFAMIKNAGFSEVQEYVNLTGHLITWGYPLIGEAQFQKLPTYLQEIFLQAAKEMQNYEHQLFLANETRVQEELQKEGMTFVTVNKAAFIEQSEEAIYESLSPKMKRIYKSIKTLTK